MTSGQSAKAVADGVYTTTCWECSAYCGALATVKDGKVVNYAPNPASPHILHQRYSGGAGLDLQSQQAAVPTPPHWRAG